MISLHPQAGTITVSILKRRNLRDWSLSQKPLATLGLILRPVWFLALWHDTHYVVINKYRWKHNHPLLEDHSGRRCCRGDSAPERWLEEKPFKFPYTPLTRKPRPPRSAHRRGRERLGRDELPEAGRGQRWLAGSGGSREGRWSEDAGLWQGGVEGRPT